MKRHASSVLLVAVFLSFPVHAQSIQQRVSALEDQVEALIGRVRQLTIALNAQNGLIGQLTLQNQTMQAKLGCMSKTGDDVYFTGCNVHVVSGTGATDGAVNGLGNLVVGYNEDAAALGSATRSERGGSHNLVVGPGHSYTSYGGLVAGRLNFITGSNSSVSGGDRNTASGSSSSVSGGGSNTASGVASSVSGGAQNESSGLCTSVSGGRDNRATGLSTSVSGGRANTTMSQESSVSGGWGNSATALYTSVSGGVGNRANGDSSSVSGGSGNRASGEGSSVSGGAGNIAGLGAGGSFGASVSGGIGNYAVESWSSISGGLNRTAPGRYDWAAGGLFQDE